MRMAVIMALSVLTFVLGFSDPSSAQSRKVSRPTMSPPAPEKEAPFVPEMMAYDEFKALNKTAQVKYIRELRNLMVLLADSSGWEQASNSHQPKWQNWLESILETAEARTPAFAGCPVGYAWGPHPKAPRTQGCFPVRSSAIRCAPGYIPFVVAEDGHTCQKATGTDGSCPSGMIRLEGHNSEGTAACVRADAGSITPIPGVTIVDKPAGVPDPMAPTDPRIAGRPAIAGLPSDSLKPADKAAPAAPGTADKPKSVDDNPLSEEDKKFFSEALEGKHMKPSGTAATSKADDTAKPADEKINKCWWDEMKCAPLRKKDKQSARKEFAELGCIYAGNLSVYKDPSKPKAGQCNPIGEAAFGGKKFSCSGKGQTLCNPLIFGVQDFASGKGHCVKGENSTMECGKKGDANKTAGFIQSLEPGIAKAEWEKLREGLKKLVASCIYEEGKGSAASKASSAFHCKECQVIAKRVVELRKVAASNMAEMKCDVDGVKPVALGTPEGTGTAPEAPAFR